MVIKSTAVTVFKLPQLSKSVNWADSGKFFLSVVTIDSKGPLACAHPSQKRLEQAFAAKKVKV